MPERLITCEEHNRDQLLGTIGDLVRFAVETGTASADKVAQTVHDELEEARPPDPNDPGMRWGFCFSSDDPDNLGGAEDE